MPVKSVLKKFIDTIVSLKHCVVDKNTKCLLDTLKTVGIVGTVNAIKHSDGELEALFWQMLNDDLETFGKLYGLSSKDGDAAVKHVFNLFDTKTGYINTYLGKRTHP